MPRRLAALMRHGVYRQPDDVPSAHLPYPLTNEGRELARQQARLLARTAAEKRWTIDSTIDCSRLLRAWQTAEIVATELERELGGRFELEQFDALAERGLGSAANLTTRQIERVIDEDPRFESLPGDWKRRGDFRLPLPGAESMRDAGLRTARHIVERIERVAAAEPGRPADTLKLFVGHGGAFRHAAAELGAMDRADIVKYSMHHCRPVYLEKIELDVWRRVAGEWKRRERAVPLD